MISPLLRSAWRLSDAMPACGKSWGSGKLGLKMREVGEGGWEEGKGRGVVVVVVVVVRFLLWDRKLSPPDV